MLSPELKEATSNVLGHGFFVGANSLDLLISTFLMTEAMTKSNYREAAVYMALMFFFIFTLTGSAMLHKHMRTNSQVS